MLRSRAFHISLLISLCWHVVWISAVSIVAVPTGLDMATYTDVYFIGPVMEKTAFELMAGQSPLRTETLYMRPMISHYTFEVEIEEPGQQYPQPSLELVSSSLFNMSLTDIVREDKATVPYFFKDATFVFTHPEAKSLLEGRTVLFKPSRVPQVPLWVTQERQRFLIELEFTVSPEGNVEKVVPIVSSGFPKVDLIGMEYLKKWRFNTLTAPENQKRQIGRLAIELEVE